MWKQADISSTHVNNSSNSNLIDRISNNIAASSSDMQISSSDNNSGDSGNSSNSNSNNSVSISEDGGMDDYDSSDGVSESGGSDSGVGDSGDSDGSISDSDSNECQQVSIACWNIHGLSDYKQSSLIECIRILNIDVLAISETHIGNSEQQKQYQQQ